MKGTENKRNGENVNAKRNESNANWKSSEGESANGKTTLRSQAIQTCRGMKTEQPQGRGRGGPHSDAQGLASVTIKLLVRNRRFW
jgi:hypothetical protein